MDILGLSWLGIIAFSLLMYVVLDGFTLGVGSLFPFLSADEKDIAVSTLLPTWDGNQTWLVLSLACFYGMFPIAFAYIFPKIYVLAILLALTLLFRGICFEFRLKSKNGIKNWDKLFFVSSLAISFIQGVIVGKIIVGYPNSSGIEPLIFEICTGFALVTGYMLLGACRLILKTENDLLKKSRILAKRLILVLVLILITIGALTSWINDLPWDNTLKMTTVAILGFCVVIFFVLLVRSINEDNHAAPYWYCIGVFTFTYLSFLALIFPYIIPYKITYMEAQASDTTLLFTLIPAVIMVPLLLLYTGYAYYIFRGKTKEKLKY